jgi:hypothetical protein
MKPIVGNALYSGGSMFGYSIIAGIITWSYLNDISFLLYSTLGLSTLCVAMLRKYAARKGQLKWNGNWNGLSFGLILWFFVFLIVGLTIAYLLYEKYGH